MIFDGYDTGFADGFNMGHGQGFSEGYVFCQKDYEIRLGKLWAELQTLNARIDYLSTKIDEGETA